MIAGAEGDDPAFIRPAALDPVLARELQCGFDGLGAATEEVKLGQIPGEDFGDFSGELFDRPMREHGAGEVAELPRLLRHCRGNLRIRMAQVCDVRAADGVEIALAAFVEQPAAFAAHDLGILVAELAVEDGAVGVLVGRHPGKATVHARKGRALGLAPH